MGLRLFSELQKFSAPQPQTKTVRGKLTCPPSCWAERPSVRRCFERKNMKISKSIFVSLLLIFYGLLIYTYFTLPHNVAIHFSLGGESNGWMSKVSYIITFGFIGTLSSLLVMIPFYKFRSSTNDTINLPNRDYWLATERFQQTILDLMNFGIWFANVTLIIFIGAGFLILDANMHPNVHLIPFKYGIVLLLIPFVILLWKFFRHFKITA
jgi:hypothetical protein